MLKSFLTGTSKKKLAFVSKYKPSPEKMEEKKILQNKFSIHSNLRHLMELRGIKSFSQLAKLTGINASVLKQYADGKSRHKVRLTHLDLRGVYILSRLFDCDLGDIFSFYDDNNKLDLYQKGFEQGKNHMKTVTHQAVSELSKED
jgi:hypothetical protein